ncbi:MAG: hypothetical protein CEE38_02310 [Planctomycetes bacterium B3_Pla]|nr:MAG: hypothetical protein CEE38_02310 [Planctomycetes bacterium B3_Pla]
MSQHVTKIFKKGQNRNKTVTFKLLELFLLKPERALTRDEILNAIWSYDCYVGPRSIDRFVTTLRNKIEPDPHNPTFIHTIREIGYKFEPPEGI